MFISSCRFFLSSNYYYLIQNGNKPNGTEKKSNVLLVKHRQRFSVNMLFLFVSLPDMINFDTYFYFVPLLFPLRSTIVFRKGDYSYSCETL